MRCIASKSGGLLSLAIDEFAFEPLQEQKAIVP
jgi:hypothetical protein